MSSQKRSVLVLGGCGFVGYHIVRSFFEDSAFDNVSVLSRSASHSKNRVEGVSYFDGDIAERATIQLVLSAIKPTVIINAASPSYPSGTTKDFRHVAIDGTEALLQIATESPHVRAVIYTSSAAIAKGRQHMGVREDHKLANDDRSASEYARTKALAEIMVLDANNPPPFVGEKSDSGRTNNWSGYLRTGSIRLPMVYGTHDNLSMPGFLSILENGQQTFQVGNGKNLWDVCSTENAVTGHFLLAEALLDDQNARKVAGEAFNIHDGKPRPFWGIARSIWTYAGYNSKKRRVYVLNSYAMEESTQEEIHIIPAGIAMAFASLVEVLCKIFTLGSKKPLRYNKRFMEFATYEHTYSIDRAKSLLGFVPKENYEAQLEIAVKWALRHGNYPNIKNNYWDPEEV